MVVEARVLPAEDLLAALPGVSKLGTLGSGSDYTAFIDRLGIPSLDFSFQSPAGTYGTYHSVYDSFTYATEVVDPGLSHHAAASRLLALLLFRLADAPVLPHAPATQAKAIRAYVAELAPVAANASVTVAPLAAAAARFDAASACAERAKADAKTPAARDDVNDHLALVERKFLGDGLPDRPWYKHVLQAPGFYLGYGSTAFPGPVHAIEDGKIDEARDQVLRAASAIEDAAAYLAELCAP